MKRPSGRDFPWLDADSRFTFPDPSRAPGDGPLASGGNLSPGMLLSAYEQGIFPWFSDDNLILWWSPDPRFVIFPDEVHVSESMRKILRQKKFLISFDTAFDAVIAACSAMPRPGQNGTWITSEMRNAYSELHRLGYAHSVETWFEGNLVGGLYGISFGRIFCGESMFSTASNASKAAFLTVWSCLRQNGKALIDSQVHTPLFESFGARNIPRAEYLAYLQEFGGRAKPEEPWTQRFAAMTHEWDRP